MVEKENIEKIVENIARDFSFLKNRVLAILIFGSASKGIVGEKSDIDICIVAPNKNPKELLKEIFQRVDVSGKKYDVYVFEELPLYLKMEVIKTHTIVFGDPRELGEYFYLFRKLWEDQKHRQKLTKEEMLKILD